MNEKRKRKNSEQTFIRWQLGAWHRLINAEMELHRYAWDEASYSDKTGFVGCLIPAILITILAFCGLVPSALFRINPWYSTIACVGVYAAVLIWAAKCWLNGRYDEYIDDLEEAEESKDEFD